MGIVIGNIAAISAYDLGEINIGDCIDLYQWCGDCSYVNLTAILLPNGTTGYT